MTVTIMTGDCRDRLKELPDESVQCVVTSPPYYGLRTYGTDLVNWPACSFAPMPGMPAIELDPWTGELGLEPTPEMYIAHVVMVFRVVRRVLREDGVAWLNIGDSYAANRGYQVPPTKWKALDFGPSNAGSVPDGLKPKDLIGIPWRLAFALQADGWWLRSDVIWHKPNPMPESVTDRPTKAHEYVFLLSKAERYFYDHEAIKEESLSAGEVVSLGERSFSKRQADGAGREPTGNGLADSYTVKPTRNKRSVWSIATKPFSEAHFAVMPPDLVEPCIKAGTSEHGCCPECGAPWERIMEKGDVVSVGGSSNPDRDKMQLSNSGPLNRLRSTGKNASQYANQFVQRENITTGWRPTCAHDAAPVPCTVLDPFGGAGTVGLVADRLKRDAILVELNEDYAEMARRRIVGDAPLLTDVRMVGE